MSNIDYGLGPNTESGDYCETAFQKLEARAAAIEAAMAGVSLPTLAIATGISKDEGSGGGTTGYDFPLTLNRRGFTGAVSYSYTTVGTGGSPADASDFQNGVFPSGSGIFQPGETAKVITAAVNKDSDLEPNENFQINVIATIGLTGVSGTATIGNDDAPPTIVAARPWVPMDAPSGTWAAGWDVSDRTTRGTSGIYVDSVADKSGNSRALSSTGSARPNFNADYMGAEAAGYDNADDVLVSVAMTLPQPLTIYQTLYAFGQTNAHTWLDGQYGSGRGIIVRQAQIGNTQPFVWSAGTGFLVNGVQPNRNTIIKSRFANGTGAMSQDGAAESTGTIGTDGIAGQVRLGNSPSTDAPFSGFIGESWIAGSSIAAGSDLDNRMSGYLGWKWGSFDSLPAGHPYRYVAPLAAGTPTIPNVGVVSGPYVAHGATGSWNSTNICDPDICEHPTDASKLIMFCMGQTDPVQGGPTGSGKASIGRFLIDKANPTAAPTFTGVVLSAGPGWDNADWGVRLGSVLLVGSTIYLYYCTQRSDGLNELGVATSTDAGVTFVKQSGPLLSPSGDESTLGEPAIWWEGGVATIIYSYRTAPSGLYSPLPGYRYAQSNSLTGGFAKGDHNLLYRFRRGIQMEQHSIYKRNGKYYLLYEAGGNGGEDSTQYPTQTPYRLYLAVCDTLTGQYMPCKVVMSERGSSATWEKYHVATGRFYTINGVEYLFRTAADDVFTPYTDNRWNLFMSPVTGVFDTTAASGGSSAVSGFAMNGSSNTTLKAMLARVAAGTGRGKIVFKGDSTSMGQGGGIVSGQSSDAMVQGASAALYRPSAVLASQLAGIGYPALDNGFVGSNGTGSSTGNTEWLNYEPRATYEGTQWTLNFAQSLAGGAFFNRANGGDVLDFTPLVACNRFEVVAYNAGGAFAVAIGSSTSITITPSGGASVAGNTVTLPNTSGFSRLTITCPTTSTDALRIVQSGGTSPLLRSARGWNSAVAAIDILNHASGGATSNDQAASSTWSNLEALGFDAPDLTIINLGLNDGGQSVPVQTYTANLQALINKAKLTGDVLLVSPHPANPASFSPTATQLALRDAAANLAATNGVAYMDLFTYFGSWAAISGRSADGIVHLNRGGYAEVGQVYRQCIQAMAA